MNRPAGPPAGQQIRFLRNLGRLLEEGRFTGSYKYALLLAIADLCVYRGDDSGAELELDTAALAEQFVRLYWRQAAPFIAGDQAAILRQNTRRQAAVILDLADLQDRYQGSLLSLERDPVQWAGLIGRVDRKIRQMPLWKLQTVGSERLDFLYPNREGERRIRLRPGVAYCFRAFYPMLTDLIRGAWTRFVQKQNSRALGSVADLNSFLFGAERRSLSAHRDLLTELQQGRCFYCERPVRQGAQVDHFIPWRRFARDLGHNFVLAHRRCNSSKSDRLAAEEHLQRWTERARQDGEIMSALFDGGGIHHDWDQSQQIARWAYRQVHSAGGQVWVRNKDMRTLSPDWEQILSPAGFAAPVLPAP